MTISRKFVQEICCNHCGVSFFLSATTPGQGELTDAELRHVAATEEGWVSCYNSNQLRSDGTLDPRAQVTDLCALCAERHLLDRIKAVAGDFATITCAGCGKLLPVLALNKNAVRAQAAQQGWRVYYLRRFFEGDGMREEVRDLCPTCSEKSLMLTVVYQYRGV